MPAMRRRFAPALLLLLVLPSLRASAAASGDSSRVLWQNTRLLGTPDPPPPYLVEKTFTRVEWKNPLYLAPEPGTDLLWVVLQGGERDRPSRIRRISDTPDAESPETVLTVPGRLIYGLTFDPGYGTNRWVYLFSNGPTESQDRTNRISRYSVDRGSPPVIDPGSETILLEWRSAGHDGGDLAFGNDGMLYITSGDGTSDSDGWDSGQDLGNLLAALLRIDVLHAPPGQAYSIPADNPFIHLPGARPEIWAYGFRNPWRMDIDARTGAIWVGNNGQDLWETAYLVHRGDNFGWSVVEGNHPFYANRRRGPTPIQPPTLEHSHSEFRSLTGGVVYYGEALPELNGAYVYGDYSTGTIHGARVIGDRVAEDRQLAESSLQIVCFAVDQRGDLLIVDHGGGIYRLTRRPSQTASAPFPTRLSDTGLMESVKDDRMAPGVIPYAVNAPAWADGAQAERFVALPGSARIVETASRGWEFTNGTVLVQMLFLPGSPDHVSPARRLETRLLVKREGQWNAYTYLWNEDQSEAALVESKGRDLEIPRTGTDGHGSSRKWHVPSRAECLTCHARAVNFVLGLNDLQMDRPGVADELEGNQIPVLKRLHVLDGSGGHARNSSQSLVDPYDASADLDRRARSYLHANCSVCHVEAGGGNSMMELEFTRTRDDMRLIGTRPQHDSFGIANAMLIAPGDPERSVLMRRLSIRGTGQMPPVAITQVDSRAVALLRQWILAMRPEMPFVHAWTVDELVPDVEAIRPGGAGESGRRVFDRVGCRQCHRKDGVGGSVGPDLTGVGQRLHRRELLESILEPSKVIADAFATDVIETRDGEVLTGRVASEDATEIVVHTGSALDTVVRIERSQVGSRHRSQVSNMPAGIANVLDRAEVVDLVAFLLFDEKPGRSP